MNMMHRQDVPGVSVSPIRALRRFAQRPAPVERCELCHVEIDSVHQHLVDPPARRMMCACNACALLFLEDGGTKYRRVPRDATLLADFRLPDDRWEATQIPIGLAFIFHNSCTRRYTTIYPSPAGPTEAQLDDDVWQQVTIDNPALARMRSDVEALLINRMRGASDYFIAPIDQCYALVGLIRTHWEGLSGGQAAWERIAEFFAELRQRSRAVQQAQENAP